jgi:hypothetical protein
MLVAGCGSTVAHPSGAGLGAAQTGMDRGVIGVDDGASPSRPSRSNVPDGSGASANAPAGIAAGQLPGGPSMTGSASGAVGSGHAGTGDAGASIPSPGRSGFGFTATQIRIGVSISSDSNAALSAFGANGVKFPDGKALVNTYVNYLNRTGGIAGRKVVPVFYDYQAGGNVESSDAAACATWTQDNQVAAALGIRAGTTGSNDALTPCLTKAGVAWLTGRGDEQKFRQYPSTLYAPSLINSTRLARAVVEGLWQNRFFTPGAKIGVMYKDDEEMARVLQQGLEPALRSHGLAVFKKAASRNAFSESSNIELQFATAGVTHVLFLMPGGAAPWQFMQNANQNRHHYRYGISSDDQPAVVLQQLAPKDQLATTTGFGYIPVGDVDPGRAPRPTPGLAACLKVFRDAGYDTSASTSQLAMSFLCDPFQLLRAGWANQRELSTTSLRTGIDGLGTAFRVAGSFSARLAASRHDGASGYRILQFDGSCSCFQYAGPVRTTG